MYEISKPVSKCGKTEQCSSCGDKLVKVFSVPHLTGTRDSFGIGRNFYHQGREITNWKEWEKEGYRNPLESSSIKPEHKKWIKDKAKAVKEGRKSILTEVLGGK